MRRVKVLRALILAIALFTLVVPASLAVLNPEPLQVYVRGYVVDECGAGVIGALVEIERVQGGRIYGPSEVKNDRGDWGVGTTGVLGDYLVRVTLPDGNVVEWLEGVGDDQVKIADAVDEIPWTLTEEMQAAARAATPDPVTGVQTAVVGPVTIVTDVPCTQPPNGPTYIWGTTYQATGPLPTEIDREGLVKVQLWRWNVWFEWMPWVPGEAPLPPTQDMGWVEMTGEKVSMEGTGLWGFGIAPVPGMWKVVAEKGGKMAETVFYVPEDQAGMTTMGPIMVVLPV